MLIRIVKLTFAKENIPSFEQIFEESKNQIRNFEGCMFLECYRDINSPTIFFTYSHWSDEAALEAYRKSAFFKTVWSRTKTLFAAKPEAWSVEHIGKPNHNP